MNSFRKQRSALLISAAIIAYLTIVLGFLSDRLVTRIYYLWQDRWMAVPLALGFVFVAFVQAPAALRLPDRPPRLSVVLVAGAALLALTWWGTRAIMLDYPLTRDEVSAWFDSLIFATGQPAAMVPAWWRPYLEAMVVAFQLPIEGNVAVVSAYMPGNAAMRAVMMQVAEPELLNPLLLAIGFVAAWDAARRLFPTTPGAIWVCLLVYALSAQALVNAMTSYAMTAHLALNMVWLAFFLRDRPWAHAMAMAIGAWAIGIHQIVFHPLFAAPLVLLLLRNRRWTLAAAYGAVYTAALLGWMSWYDHVRHFAGAIAPPTEGDGIVGFIRYRVITLFAEINTYTLPLMMYNLLRFFAWMPMFVLPLLIAAIPRARRQYDLAAALLLGVALTFLAMTVLLPYQGHGWGYRYFHGVIPNVVLLCGYGFAAWRERDARQAEGLVVLLGTATILIQLPFLFWQANRFVAPYAALTERIGRQTQAEFLILETRPPGSAIDQVRNRPDFTNRPLVFTDQLLNRSMVTELCRRGSVTMIERSTYRLVPFGFPEGEADGEGAWLRSWLPRQPCWRAPIG